MLTPPTQGSDDELLNDLLDSRLAPAESRALEARLEREPLLREAYDELLRTRELFRAALDPAPPADFTARVRARLEAEEAASAPPARLAAERELAAELTPEVPRVWRRLMLAAYAAAALLMVGIGLISLRRGSQGETVHGGAAPIETAGRKALGLEAEGLRSAEDERATDKKDAGRASGEKLARLKDGGDSAGLPALVPALAQGKSEAGRGVGELPAPASGAARGAPRLGPGGAVRPGLRVPSDNAPTTPVPSDGVLPEGVLAEPVLNVLLLEARTAAEGRALVAQVLAGPSARAAEADEVERGFTRVLLRRADVRADAALLLRLRATAPAAAAAPQADPRPPEKERAAPLAVAPPAAAPSAPAAPAAPAATTPPPPTSEPKGPAPTPAASAAAYSPTVLADFWQDLSADQQARLEALLGPLPASGFVPSGGGGGAAPAPPPSLPRRVRIVITAAR